MIYIVSGYMRSGTSMMMACLEAGGIPVACDRGRDGELNAHFGEDGYVPNERYLELGFAGFSAEDFPAAYDGMALKCLSGGIMLFPVVPIRVIFMRRATEAIKSSALAMTGRIPGVLHSPYFQQRLDRAVAALRDRRSVVSLHEVQYEDVVANPLPVFERLHADGWPIDPEAAAQIPQPGKVRSAA